MFFFLFENMVISQLSRHALPNGTNKFEILLEYNECNANEAEKITKPSKREREL
jgi:hypothetical protein